MFSFQTLPGELVGAFFDLLYLYRGGFLRRVDEVLGPSVTDFIEGKRPLQPPPFGQMNQGQMEKHPMDSEYFIEMSRIIVRSMPAAA